MKYLIKGELELKIGGGLLPDLCDFRVGAILTDESMALFTGQAGTVRLEEAAPQHHLPDAIQDNSWLKSL